MSGDVRVLEGDCLDVMAGMPDGSIDCMITDPPYGINYCYKPCGNGLSAPGINWTRIEGDSEIDGRWLVEAYRVCRNGAACYFCCRWDVEPEWRLMAVGAGWKVAQRLTWHKRLSGIGDTKGTYSPTCEDVLFLAKGRHRLNRRYPMLLDVGCVPTWEYRHHPHQKPIALAALLIEASTKPGDLVLDPFAGSGWTGVACRKSGRRCILIESDGRYIPAIHERLDGASAPLLDLMDERRPAPVLPFFDAEAPR